MPDYRSRHQEKLLSVGQNLLLAFLALLLGATHNAFGSNAIITSFTFVAFLATIFYLSQTIAQIAIIDDINNSPGGNY